MAIITKITQPGNNLTGSLNGRIVLDEGRGKISITEQSGQERSRLDLLGLTTIRSNGTYANRMGQAKTNLRDGTWTANDGEDLKVILDGE